MERHCGQISELLLVRVDGKTVYRDLEFEADQLAHQQSQLQRLRSAHQDIVSIMARVYETFRTDGAEVRVWEGGRVGEGGYRSGCVYVVLYCARR